MIWKYKIDLKEKDAIYEIEKILDLRFPNDLLKYIKVGNAATPEKNKIFVCGNERVVASMLSFNKEENIEDIYMFMNHVKMNRVIPFAIDPFGNLFVYFVDKQTVGFWNHEDDEYEDSALDIKAFFGAME